MSEQERSNSGRVTRDNDGRGFTVTIRTLTTKQKAAAVSILLLALAIVAGIIAADDPSATGALLVPLVFCLCGLYFFYNRRVARIRISGPTFAFSRWRTRSPVASGLKRDMRVSNKPIPTIGRLIVLRFEGDPLFELYPAKGDEARMIEAAFKLR